MDDVLMKAIHQAVTHSSLFEALSSWLANGSSQGGQTIRFLSAFASSGAVEALEPVIDLFLSESNRVEAIIGLDLGGTDRVALRRLHSLKAAYHGQVQVWVWDAPQVGSIFHPKLYLFDKGRELSAIIGSANLTLGGLGSNLESIVLFEDLESQSSEARELVSIWQMFASPAPPLRPEFLRELTADVLAELSERMPPKSREDAEATDHGRRALWRPLSKVPLSTTRRLRVRRPLPHGIRSYLLMDVLDETRLTQVQPPATVMEGFFRITAGAAATIEVSIITSEGMSQPIPRHIVTSNYMRRIEVPQIRDLARPCGILFVRLPGGPRRFAYRVIANDSTAYKRFDRLLAAGGSQARTRRFLIGRKGDSNWEEVNNLLAQ